MFSWTIFLFCCFIFTCQCVGFKGVASSLITNETVMPSLNTPSHCQVLLELRIIIADFSWFEWPFWNFCQRWTVEFKSIWYIKNRWLFPLWTWQRVFSKYNEVCLRFTNTNKSVQAVSATITTVNNRHTEITHSSWYSRYQHNWWLGNANFSN